MGVQQITRLTCDSCAATTDLDVEWFAVAIRSTSATPTMSEQRMVLCPDCMAVLSQPAALARGEVRMVNVRPTPPGPAKLR